MPPVVNVVDRAPPAFHYLHTATHMHVGVYKAAGGPIGEASLELWEGFIQDDSIDVETRRASITRVLGPMFARPASKGKKQ